MRIHILCEVLIIPDEVHTTNQFTVTPIERYTRLKIDCQGKSTPKFKISSKGGKAL